MKKKKLLTIHMLGEFTIENGYNHFPKDRKKSVQVIILMAYLIIHRHSMVTKAKLIDILWPEHDIDNPEGALRNLIYRARKELAAFYPEEGKSKCIISKGNAYAWNEDVPQILDIDDLEKLSERIINEKNTEDMRMDAIQLCSRYNEAFMFEFSEPWVKENREHYQNTLLGTVEKACRVYLDEEKYEYVVELCSYIDFKNFYNSQIHEYKLQAYYHMKQMALAISYYHQVVDQYYSHMGMKPTEVMTQIYKQLSEQSLQNSLNVEALEKNLNENRRESGAFYCDFDIFRNIYQINQRSVRRTIRSRFLVLLTINNSDESLKRNEMAKEAEILHKVIMADLRKNDIFSKCNSTQFALIVGTAKEEGCLKAVDRILARYEMRKKHACINVEFEIQQIV